MGLLVTFVAGFVNASVAFNMGVPFGYVVFTSVLLGIAIAHIEQKLVKS